MPQFPPGTPNNVSVTPVPLQVFTPTPGVTSSVRFYNPGPATVYVGLANVSPVNGLPIAPGNRPVELQNANTTLYACSGYSSAGATTTLSAATTAGSTTFTPGTLLTAGSYYRIGNATGVEFVQAASVSASSAVTTTTPLLYDHATGATVATLTVVPGPLSVQAGVV